MGKNWYERKLIDEAFDARRARIARLRKILNLPPLEEEEEPDKPIEEIKPGEWVVPANWAKAARSLAAAGMSASTAFGQFNMSWGTNATNTTNTVNGVWVIDKKEPAYEQEDLPILAQRYAGMIFYKSDKHRFVSINGRHGYFDVDSEAECKRASRQTHDAPEWGCYCGFYAVPADKLPKHDRGLCATTGDPNLVILQVELSGKVIIHDEGYRAQYQRVLEVRVPDCHCGRPSQVAWFNASTGKMERVDCGRHKSPLLSVPGWTEEAIPDIYKHCMDELSAVYMEKALKAAGIEVFRTTSISLDHVSRFMGVPFTRYEI